MGQVEEEMATTLGLPPYNPAKRRPIRRSSAASAATPTSPAAPRDRGLIDAKAPACRSSFARISGTGIEPSARNASWNAPIGCYAAPSFF